MKFSRRVKRAWEKGVHRQTAPSLLLNLPLELRLKIWQYAVGGWNIAIFREAGPDRKRGRLAHGILDDSNTSTPGHMFHISERDVKETINQVYGLTGGEVLRPYYPDSDDDSDDGVDFSMLTNLKRPRVMSKRKLSALLKTCRSVYHETVGLLYSCNFFIFLHNSALGALRAMVPWNSFAQIRHLHLHATLLYTSFDDISFITRLDRDEVQTFAEQSGDILVQMPNVQNLSIFFSDNLRLGEPCMRLTECLTRIAQNAQPRFFMIRVPYPSFGVPSSDLALVPEEFFDPSLPFLESNAFFLSCKAPPTDATPDMFGNYDWYHGYEEVGWMVGSWYGLGGAERDKSGRDFGITDYAVFTEDFQRETKREFIMNQLYRVRLVYEFFQGMLYWRVYRPVKRRYLPSPVSSLTEA